MKCTCLTIISFDLALKPCEVCRGLLQSLFLQMKNWGDQRWSQCPKLAAELGPGIQVSCWYSSHRILVFHH